MVERSAMNPRILFVHNRPAKSVRIDLALLQERYSVREWNQRARAINLPRLRRAVAQSDLVFGWFASWHTLFLLLLARRLQRPSLLVAGGYDTAAMPEIGYGRQHGGIERWVARTTMRLASRVIACSEFSRQEAINHAQVDPNRICTIHLGLEDCECEGILSKDRMALTVGSVDRVNLQRKGLEPFVRAAALLPAVPFVLIGAWRDRAIDELRAIASANVTFTGWVTDNTLRDYFAQAHVYVQASMRAGFGLAVAEAMSFECVPVVTRVGSLAEVVGETGIYLDAPSPEAIADGVQRALTLDEQWGARSRARIAREFPLSRRRAQLHGVVEKVWSAH